MLKINLFQFHIDCSHLFLIRMLTEFHSSTKGKIHVQILFSVFIFISHLFFSKYLIFATELNQPNDGCCIEKVVENKIYLKSTTVYVAKNGIFINVKGNLLAVDHLEMDQQGVYVNKDRLINDYLHMLSENDIELRGMWGNTWKCPKEDCGYENYDGVDKCALCGTKKPRN